MGDDFPLFMIDHNIHYIIRAIMNEQTLVITPEFVYDIRDALHECFIKFLEACRIVTTHARRVRLQSKDIALVRSTLCPTGYYGRSRYTYHPPGNDNDVSDAVIRHVLYSVGIRGLYRISVSAVKRVLWDIMVNLLDASVKYTRERDRSTQILSVKPVD
jgi:histone H3/H4